MGKRARVSPCRCCTEGTGGGLHTCYEGHECARESCEWCGHALGQHRHASASTRTDPEG